VDAVKTYSDSEIKLKDAQRTSEPCSYSRAGSHD